MAHRDLKPENFLFQTTEENSDIKIIDFGVSKTKSFKGDHDLSAPDENVQA